MKIIKPVWKLLRKVGKNIFWGLVIILITSNSGVPSGNFAEIVRVNTRWIEFDYVSWTLETLWRKASQMTLGTQRYLSEAQQTKIAANYFDLINEQQQLRNTINQIYTDPANQDPHEKAQPYLNRQLQVKESLKHVGYLYEAVLQQQVSFVAANQHLGFLDQPLPPVQYHTTSMPYALIVSPRNVIRQDADISLLPDLTLDQIDVLEKTVEEKLNVSALVVEIGGVGVYPTMVMETNSLTWLAEVVAHEWTHNFLTLRPLGLLYEQTPELRIINETTASLAGKEMGNDTIETFYPALAPKSVKEVKTTEIEPPRIEPEPPEFDFRAEMHETRVKVDQMLVNGEIEAAEAYMEQRRLVFLENGYRIRRLNQAYFAFHGAYADQPGGAAGEDPVGKAVRLFRSQSKSLDQFLKRIAWVTSYEQLLNWVQK